MRPFYRFSYTLIGLELRLHRIRIEGRENIPPGGCLVVANHVSFMDPTTVGWAFGREMYFLGRRDLFRPPVLNWFLPMCNVLPVDRDAPDISGLRRIIKMLQAGESVLIFPEGTRSHDGNLQPAEPGAGMIAIKAAVPILPVRVFGTYESLSRSGKMIRLRPIRVVIGAPYLPAIPPGEKPSYQKVAQEMMDRIALLK
jgi:1-acyl-sn-glycerol-3-phosphate acyltransferase